MKFKEEDFFRDDYPYYWLPHEIVERANKILENHVHEPELTSLEERALMRSEYNCGRCEKKIRAKWELVDE